MPLNRVDVCPHCGCGFERNGWAGFRGNQYRFKLHLKRCARSTPAEREFFKKRGDWPKGKNFGQRRFCDGPGKPRLG